MSGPGAIRAFVALELPEPVRAALGALEAQARSAEAACRQAVNWAPPSNLHLTLVFLGQAEPDALEDLGRRLEAVAPASTPFELGLAGPGTFPPQGQARVLWVGLAPPVEALLNLQARVARASAEAGFPLEERAYSPHLTVGRLRDRSPSGARHAAGDAWRALRAPALRWPVTSVVLMKSDLGKGGPRYSRVREFRLGQGRD